MRGACAIPAGPRPVVEDARHCQVSAGGDSISKKAIAAGLERISVDQRDGWVREEGRGVLARGRSSTTEACGPQEVMERAMGIEPTGKALPELEYKRFRANADAKCD